MHPDLRPSSFLASDARKGRVLRGLSLLRDAWEAAQDLGLRAEVFAVEVGELRSAGLTATDLRWLVAKGLADHLREVGKGNPPRPARRDLRVADDSCFVLTAAGLRFAPGAAAPAAGVPRWDGAGRQLLWDGCLVKRYRVPAVNQEAVLAALEELGWPGRIDDPLPPAHDIDPRARLHDTIKALNRNQAHRLLCFQGDGTGRGVVWCAARP